MNPRRIVKGIDQLRGDLAGLGELALVAVAKDDEEGNFVSQKPIEETWNSS